MKIVSAMELRKHFGHILNVVSLTHSDVIIERAGKKIARLTAVEDSDLSSKLDLRKAKGLGKALWRGIDVDQYVKNEREGWA